MPSWGWRSTGTHHYRFEETGWWVEQDWVSNRWYVVRDGKHLLQDFDDAGQAMEAADRLRKAEAK